jgi:hypothetical protein
MNWAPCLTQSVAARTKLQAGIDAEETKLAQKAGRRRFDAYEWPEAEEPSSPTVFARHSRR